ncbi:hypothetical protein [Halorussus sp. AFM4]|uniref:hypothetical protein n=1 Tax=Halorussus sp. AFM4 TaxID=3421651 RepID=UPI003EC0AACC
MAYNYDFDYDEIAEVPLCDSTDSVRDGLEGCTWDTALGQFTRWQENCSNGSPLVEDWSEPSVQSFTGENDSVLLEKVKSLREGLRKEHHVLWTYVITLNGRPSDEGGWLPPADFTEELLSSWPKVRDSMYAICEGSEYEYVRVLDASETAHPHVHLIILSSEELDANRFENCFEAHVAHCDVAYGEDHIPDRSIRYGRSLEIDKKLRDNLECFLENRRGNDREMLFNTLLWSMDVDRFDFSKGAEDYF